LRSCPPKHGLHGVGVQSTSDRSGGEPANGHSRLISQQRPLLSEALERFHSELKSDDEAILDVGSVEELLAQAKAMEPALSSRSRPSLFKRLESILPHINDFAAIIAVCSGTDAKATGLVWGSLKVVFMVAPTLI
jgi:hypothetical protein